MLGSKRPLRSRALSADGADASVSHPGARFLTVKSRRPLPNFQHLALLGDSTLRALPLSFLPRWERRFPEHSSELGIPVPCDVLLCHCLGVGNCLA